MPELDPAADSVEAWISRAETADAAQRSAKQMLDDVASTHGRSTQQWREAFSRYNKLLGRANRISREVQRRRADPS